LVNTGFEKLLRVRGVMQPRLLTVHRPGEQKHQRRIPIDCSFIRRIRVELAVNAVGGCGSFFVTGFPP
jgi:hypothetical protein